MDWSLQLTAGFWHSGFSRRIQLRIPLQNDQSGSVPDLAVSQSYGLLTIGMRVVRHVFLRYPFPWLTSCLTRCKDERYLRSSTTSWIPSNASRKQLKSIHSFLNAQRNISRVCCTNRFGRNARYLVTANAIFIRQIHFWRRVFGRHLHLFKGPSLTCRAPSMVYGVLRYQHLYAYRKKCSFGLSVVAFLGHTEFGQRLSVDKKKTCAIAQMAASRSKQGLISFLGLAGYYRRFICDFATHALPLNRLTKHDS